MGSVSLGQLKVCQQFVLKKCVALGKQGLGEKDHLIIMVIPFLFVGECSTGGKKLDYLCGPIGLVR